MEVAPSPSAAAASAAPTAPPTTVVAPTVEPTVAAVALGTDGLPPVSTGPAIHLESLPITTRDVDGHHTPSVTFANPTTQTNVDAWLESMHWCHGRPTLALDGFVSYGCRYMEPAAGGDVEAAFIARITPAGVVENLHPEDLFLPNTDLRGIAQVWVDDPHASVGDWGFGPNGASLPSPVDSGEPLHIPWRTIAPYVRIDGPLGPPLVAAGLALAPAGTVAPPLPETATALSFTSEWDAMRAAARATPEVRATMRLRVTSQYCDLLVPSGSTDPLPAGATRRGSWFAGAMATLVPVRIESAVVIHESPGPHTPALGALPAGARVLAAIGPVNTRSSELGTGWALVGAGGVRGGYVQGRAVVASDGCGAPAAGPDEIAGYAEIDASTQLAWTIGSSDAGARTSVTLFPVDAACAIGVQARRVVLDGVVTELRVTRATQGGEPLLFVVVAAADLDAPARTVSVFGPDGETPLWVAVLDAPVIRLGELHGPDHAAGYFPLTVASGAERTWLAWNGTGLDARVP